MGELALHLLLGAPSPERIAPRRAPSCMARRRGAVWLTVRAAAGTRRGSPVADISPKLRRQSFKNLPLPPPSLRQHPCHLAGLLPFAAVCEQGSEERAGGGGGGGGRALQEAQEFGGNLSAGAGWVSFVRFRAWGPKMSPLRSPLGGRAQSPDNSAEISFCGERDGGKGRDSGRQTGTRAEDEGRAL